MSSIPRRRLLLVLALAACSAVHAEDKPQPSALLAIPNARVPIEGMLTGGQPTREQLQSAAAAGYRTVINLRPASEEGILPQEASIVADLGMRYVHLPIAGPADLTKENVTRLDAALGEAGAGPVLFHCASGNRVGALLALRAAWIGGASPEDALRLGKNAGLTRLEAATRERLDAEPTVLRQSGTGFYQELSWARDARSLLVSVLETNATPEGFEYRVQRLTLDPPTIEPLSAGPRDLWTSWSPDGSRIAFASGPGEAADVFLMSADGASPTRLTDDPANDTQPAWSPDGRRIAFVSNREGTDQLFVMAADGSGQTRIGAAEGEVQTPSWSPDGKKIAYFEIDADGQNHVYVMNSDGTGRRRLATGLWPSWSPDGARILFGTPEGLSLMNEDGSGTELLVPDVEFGEFSPDGSRIAYVATDGGFVSVWVMKADATHRVQLVTRPAPEW